jgi:hypothetical protein
LFSTLRTIHADEVAFGSELTTSPWTTVTWVDAIAASAAAL